MFSELQDVRGITWGLFLVDIDYLTEVTNSTVTIFWDAVLRFWNFSAVMIKFLLVSNASKTLQIPQASIAPYLNIGDLEKTPTFVNMGEYLPHS